MARGAVLVIENAPADPVGRLGDWLVAAGAQLDVREPGDLPETLEDHAGLVVLGFPGSAHERAYDQGKSLLREAVSREVPTLGICGGAQLLGLAHGGTVDANPDGPELGAYLVAKRASAASDPLFGPLPITPDVIQWHWDAVVDLPRGAQRLATSPLCENQAFRLGRLAWGIQFHIEASPDVVRNWAANDMARLQDYDVDAILARVDGVDLDVVEVWVPFAEAFAAIVADPDSVPQPRGVATHTAAPITDPQAIRAALAAEAAAAQRSRADLPMPVWSPPARD